MEKPHAMHERGHPLAATEALGTIALLAHAPQDVCEQLVWRDGEEGDWICFSLPLWMQDNATAPDRDCVVTQQLRQAL